MENVSSGQLPKKADLEEYDLVILGGGTGSIINIRKTANEIGCRKTQINGFMNRTPANKVPGAIDSISQSASIIHLDESNFEQAVNESSVPILVDFWASWCGPCRTIAPVLEEIAKEQGENVKIAKVDVDKHPSLASRFGIRNIPTLLFFKGGEVKDQVVGVTSKADLLSRLKALQ